VDTKWSFPNNDCKSRKEAFSLRNPAFSFIYYKLGYTAINYLDDLCGAETVNKACDAYDALGG
jgi:hypothetical protein